MKTAQPSKRNERQKTLGLTTWVLRLRIKDRHAPCLLRQSSALKALERERRLLLGYDMAALIKGAIKEGLSLHSQTVQAVSAEYSTRRKQFKKAKFRLRASWSQSST